MIFFEGNLAVLMNGRQNKKGIFTLGMNWPLAIQNEKKKFQWHFVLLLETKLAVKLIYQATM